MTVDTQVQTPEQRLLARAVDEAATLFPTLTLADRCDSCGAAAQAQVQVNPALSNVLLCGHHFRKLRDSFEAKGYIYVTELADAEAEPFTWASHDKPWPNQFRDAGSATA
jgi:hypothetical protein